MTPDLRTLGVVACGRCHGTGHLFQGGTLAAFCDCATGQALWLAAMERACAS